LSDREAAAVPFESAEAGGHAGIIKKGVRRTTRDRDGTRDLTARIDAVHRRGGAEVDEGWVCATAENFLVAQMFSLIPPVRLFSEFHSV
jgi:hypothetical protein